MASDEAIVSLTLFCEASSAAQDEREDVVWAIKNRVSSKRFESTMAGVCLQRLQFSEWNADRINNANLERGANDPDSDPVMQACRAAFYAVLGGLVQDRTHGATHYHDKTIAPPSWTVGATLTLETQHFKFYANVK